MSNLGKKYEELLESDARALKEDALRELAAYDSDQSRRAAGGGEEPRAIAGPYSYTVKELISHVEQETKVGRDIIDAVSSLKATLAQGGD
jgi:hypothetical protein